MTSIYDDANEANDAQNPGEDEKDLIDEKFQALISGLSLDQSSPTTYLDELDRNVDDEHFTPPTPAQMNLKKSIMISWTRPVKWFSAVLKMKYSASASNECLRGFLFPHIFHCIN